MKNLVGKNISLLLVVQVCLLVVLALCLTVGAVPVDQHHQGEDEQEVWYQQRVGYTRDNLVPEQEIYHCFIKHQTQ